MEKDAKIYIARLVGSAILKNLQAKGLLILFLEHTKN